PKRSTRRLQGVGGADQARGPAGEGGGAVRGGGLGALGVLDLATHTAPLEDAPALYETFQKKEDGCVKVVLKP
ncbi:hypothetical protein L2E48_26205, partial [Salmonella enterica subsp. enterica serovar Weltevreden]